MESAIRPSPGRRTFLKGAAAGAAVLPLASPLASSCYAGGDETLRIALVGCGGRGIGAAVQAMHTPGPTKLIAMADAFADRLEFAHKALTSGEKYLWDETGDIPPKVDVPPERRFVGLDAYKGAIDSGADVVILAGPPGFRPVHFEYAVQRGKHVFMEKPVAVDAPGVQRIMAAARIARNKGLKVGVGLQRRHQRTYLETIARLREGAIGPMVTLWAYWNTAAAAPSKSYDREPGWTEFEHQLRNWYYFTYLSGDHNVEQHIHNLDVCNWVMDAHPVSAQGMGGRQVRTDPKYGMIFDHHMVEYTYADGTKLVSQSRQIPDCYNSVSEHAYGTAGYCNISGALIDNRAGQRLWSFKGQSANPFQVEHDDLFAAIRGNSEYMEVENGAIATMTAILGRMATYSGKLLRWDEAMESGPELAPGLDEGDMDFKPPVRPDAAGRYPVPMPGKTRVL